MQFGADRVALPLGSLGMDIKSMPRDPRNSMFLRLRLTKPFLKPVIEIEARWHISLSVES